MKTIAIYLAALFSLLALPSMAADNAAAAPTQAVQSFYTYHFKHGLGFDSASVKARKAWLTPKLYAQLTKVLAKPVAKGDAPDIDGDVFTDSQDGPASFQVGKAIVEKGTAKVEVTFALSGEKRHFTIILAQMGKDWLIEDIDYGDHRTLVKELQAAAR